VLEPLSPGLHEYDDQSGERLPEPEGGHDGEHRHQIGGEVPGGDAAKRPPYDRNAGEREA